MRLIDQLQFLSLVVFANVKLSTVYMDSKFELNLA